MRLHGQQLEDVEWNDLVQLVNRQVPESPTLDYKATLPSRTDAGRKELLADVSAMANSSGGILLYGISEARESDEGKTDRPAALVGLPDTNAVEEQQRLEQTIRSGLDPPLARFLVRPIFDAGRSTYVLAVGVPASLLAPHAVTTATTMPFWRRAGASRYPLRTADLRRAFLERGAWEEEAEEFRARRLALQRSAPSGHPLAIPSDEPALLLHVLPLGRLREWIDLVPHWDLLQQRLTLGKNLHQGRLNFEGILRTQWEERTTRYVQWFRFGGVEAFTATLGGVSPAGPTHHPTVDVTRPTILAVEYAREAMLLMDRTFGVAPPYAVLLSILNVAGRQVEMIGELRSFFPHEDPHHAITEADLLLPGVFFEEAHDDVQAVATALRSTLDAVWQAGGIGRCRVYTKDGEWRGRTFVGWEGLL